MALFAKYKRILLKLSGDAFVGDRKYGIDPKIVDHLAKEVKAVIDLGVEVGLVIGGGNIFRGLSAAANGMDRVTADHIGILATIMNGIAFQNALERVGCPARLMTAVSIQSVAESYVRPKALHHLIKGRAVIFSGGTGNPYFTTDTTAALRAAEIGAEVLIKATLNVSTKNIDQTALLLCKENKISIVQIDLKNHGNILKLIKGENIGTVVS